MTNNSSLSSSSSSKLGGNAPRPASAISITTTPTRHKAAVRTPTGAMKRSLPSSLQRADSGEPAPVARMAPLRSALALKHRSESSPSRLGSAMEESDRESTPTASAAEGSARGRAPDSPRQSMKAANPTPGGYRKGMYVAFVSNVFQERSRGNEAPYYELISQFRTPSHSASSTGPTATTLASWLGALSHVVSSLDRRAHAELVEPILSLQWTTLGGTGSAGEAFARAWIRFVCALVSARVEWMGEVLKRAVKGLSYRSDWRTQTLSTGAPQPSRRVQYAYVHLLLRSLLELVPTLPAQLAPLLIRYFPHKREGRAAHIVYVRNALEVCAYAGELAETVLLCVVDRAMQIDVEIQIELDELDDDAEGTTLGSSLEEDPFDAAVDGLSESDSGSESDDDDDVLDSGGLGDLSDDDSDGGARNGARLSETQTQKRLKGVRELVAKLDAIMAVVLKHLEAQNRRYLDISNGLTSSAAPRAEGSGSGTHSPLSAAPAALETSPERALALRGNQFQMLLGVFARAVLPTFKSRHVQFLMFYHASLDGDFADVLLGFLISKAIYGIASPADAPHTGAAAGAEGAEPAIMRVAAASYVASLVSRARYISPKDCRAVMLNLCAFLEAHLEVHALAAATQQQQQQGQSAITGPHAVFYAVTQAAFYIFCFRWRDLRIDLDDGASDGQLATSFSSSVGVSPSPAPAAPVAATMSASGAKWSEGLSVLQRAITSALNPLAHCSPTVVRQFAGVAQHTGLLYCWSIIESNRRGGSLSSCTAGLRTPGTPTSAQAPAGQMAELQRDAPLAHPVHQSAQELDVFFPFDPYRLKLSAKWIEPLYREWADVAPDGMRGESSDDDSDDDDEEEEEEGSDGSPTRTGMRIPGAVSEVGSPLVEGADGGVSRSLEAMSLSM